MGHRDTGVTMAALYCTPRRWKGGSGWFHLGVRAGWALEPSLGGGGGVATVHPTGWVLSEVRGCGCLIVYPVLSSHACYDARFTAGFPDVFC